MNQHRTAWAAIAVLVLVACLYWPTIHGDFVWDDVVNFRWNTWLTEGDQWKHYIFRDFNYWKYYFRPLVVGLFTVQLRLFDGMPGPMHMISLAFHLLNTLCVGFLALQCAESSGRTPDGRTLPMAISMGVFGLHPVVIEAVAWVGCQYDLLLTLFTLLGLIANTRIRHPIVRAVAVAGCFFLAACTKEAAIAFPLVLVVFDWTLQARRKSTTPASMLRFFLTRNAMTLLAVLAAGIAYLAFRHLTMGPSAMPRLDGTISAFGQAQMVAFTYIRYWAILFLPTAGMSPVHEFDPTRFEPFTATSATLDIAALALVAFASMSAWRRAPAWAGITLVVTATLLPVLRILPTAFNPNLYHDRYLVCGLAVACAMFPLLRLRLPRMARDPAHKRLLHLLGAAAAITWTVASVVAIRSTVPLWANETSLWTWAYATDRNSTYAISNLMEIQLAAGRIDEARQLADRVMNERIQCASCLLSAATVALHDRDARRAKLVLQVLELSPKAYWNDKERYSRLISELRSFVEPPQTHSITKDKSSS